MLSQALESWQIIPAFLLNSGFGCVLPRDGSQRLEPAVCPVVDFANTLQS